MSGGWTGSSALASTETLVKDEGTEWQSAAELPSPRHQLAGLGLENGHGLFIVMGENLFVHLYMLYICFSHITLQVEKMLIQRNPSLMS